MTKTADPVCGSAASRGTWPVCLDRSPLRRLWRRTRCALAGGVGASHVVVDIRLAKLRRDDAGRSRLGREGSLDRDRRNGVDDNSARPSATSGDGRTAPREAGCTRAGSTQARSPRQLGLNRCFDTCHVGHLPPEWSTTNPNCTSQRRRFFQVWLPCRLPRPADHPVYFGTAGTQSTGRRTPSSCSCRTDANPSSRCLRPSRRTATSRG